MSGMSASGVATWLALAAGCTASSDGVATDPGGPIERPGTPVEPPRPEEEVEEPPEPVPPPPDLGDYDALFDHTVLQEIHIGLAEAEIEALDDEGREYVTGTFEHEGATLTVGIRLKGSSTYQTFDQKPAFRVKFNEFVAGQRYATLRGLALNNLTGDPAQGREVVAYWAWAQAGLSVPRASLARVYVNGEYFGLYAAIEAVDEEWLRRRYTDPSGDLWAANTDADLTDSGLAAFVLQCGTGRGPLLLGDAAAALAHVSSDFYAQASAVIDMDQYMDFWAWSNATGTQDGYPYHLNDYFVYSNPADRGRLRFSPWGLDETWSDEWRPDYGGAVLAWQCENDAACTARLNDRFRAALAAYEAMDVAAEAEALFSLSEGAADADPRSPYSPGEVSAARGALLTQMRGWPAKVRTAMGL